jgi:uncharacterized membrane protein
MSELPTTSPTSSGLAPNVAGALAYVLGPLTGVVFFVIEKESRFVRFHAAQSIVVGIALVVVSIALTILSTVLAFVPFVGWLVGFVLTMMFGFGSFALWLLLLYRAYQGQEWEVPGIGGHARRLLASPAVQ